MRWLAVCVVLLAACVVRAGPEPAVYTFRTDLPRGQYAVAGMVLARFEPPLVIPPGARFEYEIFVPESSASASHLFNLFPHFADYVWRLGPSFEGQREGELPEIPRNTWTKRSLRFTPKWANQGGFELVLGAPQGVVAPEAGPFEIRLRNFRVVDADGEVHAEIVPRLQDLADPQPMKYRALRGCSVGVSGAVCGWITPSRWHIGPADERSFELRLKNMDPSAAQAGTYRVELRDERTGQVELLRADERFDLAPDEPLVKTLSFPPERRGDVRVVTTVRLGEKEESFSSEVVTLSDRPQKLFEGFAAGGSDVFYGAVVELGNSPTSFAALRAAGANAAVVRVPWYPFEISRGQYDFERLDLMLREADRAGIRVCPQFFHNGAYVPPWLHQEVMLTQAGAAVNGNFKVPSFWSETAWQDYVKMVRAVVERYKDDKRIALWHFQLGNGDAGYGDDRRANPPLFNDYSEPARRAFRTYLQTQRKLSLEQASGVFGAALWSWEQLQPPPPRAELMLDPAWRLWMEFRDWSVAQRSGEVVQIIRSIDTSRPISFFGDGYMLTYAPLGELVVNGGLDNTINAMALGSIPLRQGQGVITETSGTPSPRDQHQLAMYQLLRSAFSGYCWIHFYQPIIRPGYANFARVRASLEALQGTEAGPARVALLDSASARWAYPDRRAVPWGRPAPYLGVIGWMEASGYHVDYYYDTILGSLDPRRTPNLLMAPTADVLIPEAEEALVRYVNGGGNLLLWGTSGCYTMGSPQARYALMKKLGVAQPEQWALVSRAVASIRLGEGLSMDLADAFVPAGLPANAEVLARFADGGPGILRWRVGQGTVTLIPGLVSWRHGDGAASEALVRLWTRSLGLPAPDFEPVADDIYVSTRRRGDEWYVIVLNRQAEPVRSQLKLRCLDKVPYTARDLMREDGRPISMEGAKIPLDLGANELAVFHLQPVRQ